MWQIYVQCSSHGYVALQYWKKGSLCQIFLLGSPIPYCVKIFSTAPGNKYAVLKGTDMDSVNKHHFSLSQCLHHLTKKVLNVTLKSVWPEKYKLWRTKYAASSSILSLFSSPSSCTRTILILSSHLCTEHKNKKTKLLNPAWHWFKNEITRAVRKVKNVCTYNPRSCFIVPDQSFGVFSRV
jgi:hypothetical protein